MNQRLIKSLFKQLRLSIELAENGQIGVDKMFQLQEEGRLPDLILMDMHMPGLNGMEATKKIRTEEQFQKIPIIALSADAFIEQQEAAIAAGMNDYLTKPLDLNKLKHVLQKYLRKEKKVSQEESGD